MVGYFVGGIEKMGRGDEYNVLNPWLAASRLQLDLHKPQSLSKGEIGGRRGGKRNKQSLVNGPLSPRSQASPLVFGGRHY
jgi:hypothetical protein